MTSSFSTAFVEPRQRSLYRGNRCDICMYGVTIFFLVDFKRIFTNKIHDKIIYSIPG